MTLINRLPLILIAVLACDGGGSSWPASTKPQTPASALESTRQDYVGEWEGGGVTLVVGANVSYAKLNGSMTTKYSGKLDHFDGDDIAIDFLVGKVTLVVDSPPTEVDGVWKMTVTGTVVTRKPGSGGIPDQLETLIRSKLAKENVAVKRVSCPRVKPPSDCTIETAIGDMFAAHTTLTGTGGDAKIAFTVDAPILDGRKLEAFIEKAHADKQMDVKATCPAGSMIKAVGATFTCDLVGTKDGVKALQKVTVDDKEGNITISPADKPTKAQPPK